MRVLSKETHFRFMARRGAATILSAIAIVGSIAAFLINGLNLGIEFTGGVEFEAGYSEPVDVDAVRQQLADAGYTDAQVIYFGTQRDIMIRIPPSEDSDGTELREALLSVLQQTAPDVESRSFSVVFPQIGGEVAEAGSLAMIFVLIMIFIYIMFPFQWRFSAGAVAALAHDVIITVGLFALFQFPVDSSVIAALLAVIGYSLNDTVVVFDRIRENFLSLRGEESDGVIDRSINQMLARTIITGVTTLLVLTALLVLGGESVRSFSIALIAGIVIGTYSSIYVASAVALQLGVSARDLLPPEPVDGDEIDELP
ncbi:MAG: protein translocase subunit SecF [Pseudomonadota bacterium]